MVIDTDLLLRLEQRITNLESKFNYIYDTINKLDEEKPLRAGRFSDSCHEQTIKENPDCPEDCPEIGMHEIRCKFEGFGIKDENYEFVCYNDFQNIEICRLKHDGTFIVMGREYKDIRQYVMEKEGIEEIKH